jgi:hypothetical protein
MVETSRCVGFAGGADSADRPLGFAAKIDQRRHDEPTGERLILPEAHREGGLELCFLFDRPDRLGSVDAAYRHRHQHIGLYVRKNKKPWFSCDIELATELPHVIGDESNNACDRHKKLVLSATSSSWSP